VRGKRAKLEKKKKFPRDCWLIKEAKGGKDKALAEKKKKMESVRVGLGVETTKTIAKETKTTQERRSRDGTL